jgi:hypothetical protein
MRRLIYVTAALLLSSGAANLALARGGGAGGGGPGGGAGFGYGGQDVGVGTRPSGRASASAITHSKGPVSLNRDQGVERAKDMMSAQGVENTNGPMSPDRATGTVRADRRHTQHSIVRAGEQGRGTQSESRRYGRHRAGQHIAR